MKIWIDHQHSGTGDKKVNCPFCRGEFANLKLLLLEYQNTLHDDRKKLQRFNKHVGFSCNHCQMNPIKVCLLIEHNYFM